jgi:hypothetical protein
MSRSRRGAAAALAAVTAVSVVVSVPVHPPQPPANGLWGIDPMVLVEFQRPQMHLLAATDVKLVYLAREHCLVLADRDYDGPLVVDTAAVPPAGRTCALVPQSLLRRPVPRPGRPTPRRDTITPPSTPAGAAEVVRSGGPRGGGAGS